MSLAVGLKMGAECSQSRALASAVPRDGWRKRAAEDRRKKGDERSGTFVLPRRAKVARALVDFIQFHTMRDSCVFHPSKLGNNEVQTLQVMFRYFSAHIKASSASLATSARQNRRRPPPCPVGPG